MKDIKNYLLMIKKMVPKNQKAYYDWIVSNGKSFTDSDRNREKEKELISQNHSHKEKECYYNAQILITISDEFEYYEGWYVTDKISIPLEHGFIVYKEKIIDITVNSRFKVTEYFGVKIPTEFVCARIVKNGYSDSMIFWYWKENFLDKKY